MKASRIGKFVFSFVAVMTFAALIAWSASAQASYTISSLPTAFANGISDSGTVVYGTFHAISANGLVTATGTTGNWINGLNDLGQEVGSRTNSFGQNGFYYNGTTYSTITATINGHFYASGSTTSALDARGINDSGQIVGFFTTNGSAYQGYLGSISTMGGTFTSISDPLAASGGLGTFALGINASGVIAGYYYDASGNSHGFVDDHGTFTTVDDGTNTVITGINDNGTFVGYLNNGSGPSFEATPAAPVPSPTAVWLSGSGLAGLVGIRRRFTKA